MGSVVSLRCGLDAGWGLVRVEGLQALADVVAEESDVDGAEVGGVGFEFAEGGVEEARGAEGIVALKVVEGDCDLNEGLQEELFGLGGVEPDALPCFVRGKEVGGVVVVEALGEWALGPVECQWGIHLSAVENPFDDYRGLGIFGKRRGRVDGVLWPHFMPGLQPLGSQEAAYLGLPAPASKLAGDTFGLG
jgi:hypothetical protein